MLSQDQEFLDKQIVYLRDQIDEI